MDDKQQAQIILERIAEKRNGHYYIPQWSCPAAPQDDYTKEFFSNPEFAEHFTRAEENVPKMVEKLRKEYADLKRDLAA